MRILFFGTSPFAVPSLNALLDSPDHEVLGVVTQPDRPRGRGLQLQQSPVKRAALERFSETLILQPERARRREFVDQVAGIMPEALVVAAFGQILPKRLLGIPKYGGINVHGSLLPRWRGAAPMQYALISGDAETGVTTMQMDAGMDTGDMLLKSVLPLGPDDTLETIETRLAALGAPLLLETLRRIERGDCPREKQDESLVTYSPPLPPDFGVIDWDRPAGEIANLIRGVTPRPGAWASFGGKRIKVWKASSSESEPGLPDAPGEVIGVKPSVMVAAGSASVLVLEFVQPEGKPRMSAVDWARGARLAPGMRFENPSVTT